VEKPALAQLAGAPRIDGPYELSVVLRQGSNGSRLQTGLNDLLAYLKERELIHSAGPAHLKKLVLSWGEMKRRHRKDAGCDGRAETGNLE
jgi:hypothetical protein